jgi:hypothetical protein
VETDGVGLGGNAHGDAPIFERIWPSIASRNACVTILSPLRGRVGGG